MPGRNRISKSFSVDPQLMDAVLPLCKKYGVKVSDIVENAFLNMYVVFQELEKLSAQYPEGIPTYIARAYLEGKISQTSGDASSMVEEMYPPSKKTKIKS